VTAAHTLVVEDLELGYGGRTVVESLDLVVPPAKITCIVGANACGKSTLLRSMSRLLAPRSGHVLLDGKDVHRLPAKQLARTLGLLPQSPIAPEGIVVADLVGRGRHPHQRVLSRWSREDDAAVADALAATHTTELAERHVDELSGGQRQRVWIAMALAQQTDVLLLDEPTTFLDIAFQLDVLDLCADLHADGERTLVAVLHDLNQACRYATHLIAMREGRIVAQGPPGDIVDADLVRAVFGITCEVVPDPQTGTPMIVPAGRETRRRRSDAAAAEDPVAVTPS
jgi:iron complex transport system ATP-binding protein